MKAALTEFSRIYLTLHSKWNKLCALKYRNGCRFFNIFSVDMWICFALSLVLTVITVRCISNYAHKPHLHESKFYSNIFSVTINIIAFSLSVSVNTQPCSSTLYMFFPCWVCYSVAIWTVFQAYLTKIHVQTDIKNLSELWGKVLTSGMNFGFFQRYGTIVTVTSTSIDSDIFLKIRHAVLRMIPLSNGQFFTTTLHCF